MKIQLETGGSRNIIRAYGPGRVTVNRDVYTTSLIVTPDQIQDWPPRVFTELNETHFEIIAGLEPEVAILGTGHRQHFPKPDAIQILTRANIGLEVMDTGAACRTYNILMGEGRRVAAALLMIESQKI